MTLRKVLYYMKIEKACVLRNENNECDRNCSECDLVCGTEDIIKAYDIVIDILSRMVAEDN